MKKIIATLLVTTFAVGSAYAQSTTTPSATPAPAVSPDGTTPNSTHGGSTAAVTNDNASGALVTSVTHLSAGQTTTSKIVGASVYNTNNDKIGEVSDLIIDPNGKIDNVVVGVGGFLGIGERNVAISYASIKFDKDNKGYEHLTLAATKAQLKAMAPYEGNKTGG